MSTQTLTLSRVRQGAPETDYRPARVVPVCKTERKLATVLFTDVKGSTDLCVSVDLEDWWSTIAGLFEVMCEGVYRFGGWVGAFTGDGIKGVFESPGHASEHADRACGAALWLRAAIDLRAAQLRREHGMELAVRVGLNSGEVLAGTIGDPCSSYYTASGYPVAVAKRMEGIAGPGQIYITEDTAALLQRRLKLRDLGVLEVKGLRCPTRVYELVGRRW